MPNASPSVVSAPPTIEILERQAHLGARTAPPVARAVARPRGAMIVAMTMLFVSTLPDAMVVPMLRELLVQRYHISAASAHWFMAVNLLGALLALPLLAWLRRILSPARMLGWAAAADGLLLLSMAGDVGFGATLALRLVEGAADLILLALIFDLVGKAGAAHDRGRRFGIAGTVLLLSLAGGIILGASVGRDDALRVFFISAAGCGVVVIMVTVWRRLVDGLVRSCPAAELVSSALAPARRRLWPSMAMLFGDRAIAGLMVSTVPLFMAGDQRRLLAIPLAMMALLSWPMGRLGDRI
ncbi:MAG: hypothetical protein KDA25_13130, partial [Phycisphaerales bacterium]|nr:hypothetical protein [Phycisphaerales bacterium]